MIVRNYANWGTLSEFEFYFKMIAKIFQKFNTK